MGLLNCVQYRDGSRPHNADGVLQSFGGDGRINLVPTRSHPRDADGARQHLGADGRKVSARRVRIMRTMCDSPRH